MQTVFKISPEETTELLQQIREQLAQGKHEFICEAARKVARVHAEQDSDLYLWVKEFTDYLDSVFQSRTLFGALREYRDYKPDTSNIDVLQFRLKLVPFLVYTFRHGTKPNICLGTIERLLREFVATGDCPTEGMNEND